MASKTEIQKSRQQTGRRHYRVDPQTYISLSGAVDQSRGLPKGEGTTARTLRMLPPTEDLEADADGYYLLDLRDAAFRPQDDEMMADALAAGLVVPLTRAEYDALKPEPEEP